MTSFRFLHAADLHIDSPLRGLSRYEGAPAEQLRNATREAFENLIRLALDERVDFVVLAGDLYDGEWRDYNTGLFFHRQLGLLTRAGIRVVVLHGNHDAANKMTRRLTPPEGVTVFGTRRAETVRFDDLGVALHGQGFVTEKVEDDLAAGYPEPVAGLVNVGVLHTALEGDAQHARYAPCSVASLQTKGYDYWALGHVHQRQVVEREPWIVFPGNVQGRHARETGAKGCMLVEVVDGVVGEPEFHALDVVRWAVVEVDAAGAGTTAELLGRIGDALQAASDAADGRLLAARLRVTGRTTLHGALAADPEGFREEVRAASFAVGGEVWVEKILVDTAAPVGGGRVDGGLAGLEEFLPGLAGVDDATLAADEELQRAVAAAFELVRAALPADLREELDGDDAAELLRRGRDLLVARLQRVVEPADGEVGDA